MSKLIVIDNGHGRETSGKRSPKWPDGSQLFEYEFNRDVARRIKAKLDVLGIQSVLLVPEESDVSLGERCRRANAYHKNSRDGAIVISIHANAGGGTGWECFTNKGQTTSDSYATILCEEAQKAFPDWRMRFDYSDGDPDKEEDFHILKHTIGAAVLTENFFMDTEKDCRLIMSEAGRQKIADFHVAAIRRMV